MCIRDSSIANSAATLRHAAATRADWVRPGILLYGSAPDFPEHDAAHWQLQPAMTLSTRLLSVQTLSAGDTIGYGSRFTADGPLTIGVAAVGYGDGYPRHCDTGTPVPDAAFGSEVTLWGRASNGAVLPIDEVARAAGTIGYELMCAVAPRVPVATD